MNILAKIRLNIIKRFTLSGDLDLISQSGLFDPEYYLDTNTDVKAAGVNPLKHYYYHGWKERRNPSQAFDTNYYLAANEDVKISGINPLVHYIKYGKQEGRLPKAFEFNGDECLAKADIKDIGQTTIEPTNLKIAIICHLFYLELAEEFIGYFKNIPYPYDLYITTTYDQVESIRKLFTTTLPGVNTTVMAIENKGRDIGPFITVLKENFMKYDLVCKVHSKKSGHNVDLKGWRKYLLDQLLGNPLIINRIISEFINDKQLGILWPVAYPYLSYLGLEKGWGLLNSGDKNFRVASRYFSELNLEEFGQDFAFPLGSMFWFRPKALELIIQKNIGITHFENEENQIDGTLAHAFERLFGIIPLRAGFETKTVFFPHK